MPAAAEEHAVDVYPRELTRGDGSEPFILGGDGAVVEVAVVGIAVKEGVGQGEERIVLEDVPDLGELGDLRHGEQPEVLRAGDENVAVDCGVVG